MIFPNLVGKRFGQVNLEFWSQRWLRREFRQIPEKNLLLDPTFCDKMVQSFHVVVGIEWSYGDWCQSRHGLWRGSYLEQHQTFLHLGTDFNVPAGTEVSCQWPLEILKVDSDTSAFGWGTRVIGKMLDTPFEPTVLIYAHLSQRVFCLERQVLRPNLIFGKVGKPFENGGWFPHLHIQAMSFAEYRSLTKDEFEHLDGYGHVEALHQLARSFPDPLNFISIL